MEVVLDALNTSNGTLGEAALAARLLRDGDAEAAAAALSAVLPSELAERRDVYLQVRASAYLPLHTGTFVVGVQVGRHSVHVTLR